jgi:hypothetical protein
MNTAELKMKIIRQVDILEEDILIDVNNYIQNKIFEQKTSVLDGLSIEHQKGILQAQQSIRDGNGIPHEIIVAKYQAKFGLG